MFEPLTARSYCRSHFPGITNETCLGNNKPFRKKKIYTLNLNVCCDSVAFLLLSQQKTMRCACREYSLANFGGCVSTDIIPVWELHTASFPKSCKFWGSQGRRCRTAACLSASRKASKMYFCFSSRNERSTSSK